MLKGLIPGEQRVITKADTHWQFGSIKNNIKEVDNLLHYGCFTLGFNRIDIIEHVCNKMKFVKPEIAESITHNDNLKLNDVSFELSDKLFTMSEGYRSFYALSGSDANEGAIKLSSAYHSLKNNKFQTRNKIVSFEGSYHGSTFLNSNLGDLLMDNPLYTMKRYEKVIKLPRNFKITDIDWTTVMSIIVEPCSYGGDMRPNDVEFWEKLSDVQSQYDVLIIIDDIFTGGGKTGNYFGWRNLPIKPDIATMGKAITGGYFPLSITLYNEKIHNILPKKFNWDHGYTYNFSLAGINSALKYINILEKEDILKKFDYIQSTAISTIESSGFKIVNKFGCLYMIRNGNYQNLYMIPLNADEEYFNILKQNLNSYDSY